MFSRLAAFTVLAVPLLAVATPAVSARDDIQCCDQTLSADSDDGRAILKHIGVVVKDITGLVGLDCSSINVIGVGSGDACTSGPVSCSQGVFVSNRISLAKRTQY
ncbi:hypothetical protein EIP86_009178 [Pleurotus ostreatoroseus]|nr:hypothetical protein EIP86_009178 [Pleurotus ostreatoroseus]